jgi:hypothetical protein
VIWWLPLWPSCHIFSDIVDITSCQGKGEIEQAVVAELIGTVLGSAEWRLFLIATTTAHRSGEINSALDMIVNQAANDTCNTFFRHWREFGSLGFSQRKSSMLSDNYSCQGERDAYAEVAGQQSVPHSLYYQV